VSRTEILKGKDHINFNRSACEWNYIFFTGSRERHVPLTTSSEHQTPSLKDHNSTSFMS
jgi:hypothetical protein